MRTWMYLVHPPRPDFIATITPEEGAIMAGDHSDYLTGLFDAGTLILAGPTWGQPLNDGVAIIEAEDEEAATAIMLADPAISSGMMTGELREMRVSFLRGRD